MADSKFEKTFAMNWRVIHSKFSLVTIVLILELVLGANINDSLEVSRARLLSRRKRYLVFPDGSTLQLVFCLQTSAVIPIGDIFLFGNTAALAWVLPSQPDFFNMVKEHYNYKAERRQDLNEIFYLDEKGKVIAKVPYKRKTLISPVFAKRSVEENQDMSFKEKIRLKLDKIKMHEEQRNREYLNQKHMTKRSIEFHRSSRFDLYGKLEKLLTALGRDGRACVLQKLCESKQTTDQGTFLQELAKVLFTLPKSSEYVNEEHRDYDTAHHESNSNCSILYPGCDVASEMTL